MTTQQARAGAVPRVRVLLALVRVTFVLSAVVGAIVLFPTAVAAVLVGLVALWLVVGACRSRIVRPSWGVAMRLRQVLDLPPAHGDYPGVEAWVAVSVGRRAPWGEASWEKGMVALCSPRFHPAVSGDVVAVAWMYEVSLANAAGATPTFSLVPAVCVAPVGDPRELEPPEHTHPLP